MCGNHNDDGSPIDHYHDPGKRVFYPHTHPRSRRAFLGNLGKGTMAMAVVTPTLLAACSSDGSAPNGVATSAEPDPTEVADTPAPTAVVEEAADSPAEPTASASPEPVPTDEASILASEPLTWARANLGFVSAYVLVRGNAAAIVDTGVPGSAAAIGETLADLGLNYSNVLHVILTHSHSDHAGSILEVLAEATNATAYAGEADLGSIQGDISGISGGEDIFGFEMLPTPGHTAGHMAVIDHTAGVLVAGDAIFTDGGGVVEGPERFFNDIPQSRESIKAMAAMTFNTLLVGHGDPIESAADSAVLALANSL